jgi:hypothetical protein
MVIFTYEVLRISDLTCILRLTKKRQTEPVVPIFENWRKAVLYVMLFICGLFKAAISGLVYVASNGRRQLKCDGTLAETRFRLSAKRTSPFKSAKASVQSTTDSRGVRISGSNAGYTMFRGSVKSTGYPLHSPFPSLPLPCVTVCHHISTGV